LDPAVLYTISFSRGGVWPGALLIAEPYDVGLVVVGIALLATALLPRLLEHRPLAMPIVVVLFGFAVFALPFGLEPPDPLAEREAAKRLTELGVIVALMGAGLKIERAPDLLRWRPAWLLVLLALPVTVALAGLLAWWAGGLAVASAVLFAAAIAPTDPVLASDVEAHGPEAREEPEGREEGEIRFALTAEAGMNDGLAFPFTHMAVAMALAGLAPGNWIVSWVAVDVAYRLVVAAVIGFLLAKGLARLVFVLEARSPLAKLMTGLGALAACLIVYGSTELAGGYGFIAVFVAAVTIRNHDPGHDYQEAMREVTEIAMRLLVAVILLLLGGAVAGGLLAPLTLPLAAVGIALVLVVRPVVAALALLPVRGIPGDERAVISFFGIRGIGSLYYLSYALTRAEFEGEAELWALAAFVVLVSVFLHGTLSSVALDALRRRHPAAEAGGR
jgi:sodium/hydrogen antiporter